jgi:TonB family protein
MWPGQVSALQIAVADEAAEPGFVPTLLFELDPWHRVFLRNLRDLLWPRRRPPLRLISWPAAPWPDVFVPRRFPWRGLSESTALHLAVIAAMIWAVPFLPGRPLTEVRPIFQREDVIYYSPSEYLPPLDTGRSRVAQTQKGEPEHAVQPIISVPPEADNRTQTIATPSDIKLNHDVPLPNIVAWTPTPVAVPMAATAKATADLKVPALDATVVAPPPDVSRVAERQAPDLQASVAGPRPEVNAASRRPVVSAPEVAVVAPPPTLRAASTRQLGDISIGHTQVVAPAPRLPIAEQRTLASLAAGSAGKGPTVVAPPPSTQGAGISSGGSGRVIALSVRPAPPGPGSEIPAGNRRGAFAAAPEGKAGAPGTPDSPSGQDSRGSAGGGDSAGHSKSTNGAPTGLYVGASPKDAPASLVAGGNATQKASDSDHSLVASVTPPRIGPHVPEVSPDGATELERAVFGDRKFYSMMLNMPNLNSAGGSWVIRFAELKQTDDHGDLTAPVATRKVDPAYPLEMMRRNVQGTVTLYAVIHSDGSVGDVRVLQGVDDQLDGYACTALSHWRFSPATKNGTPVALEAVVAIPFKPFRVKRSF